MTAVPWEQRLVKSPAEVARIARAASIADHTMQGIMGMVRPDMSEPDVAAFARRYVELGAEPGHVGPITSGSGWDHLHGHLHDRPLQHGDILHMELVPRFDGYSGRLMHCVAVGGATPEQQSVSDRLVALQDA